MIEVRNLTKSYRVKTGRHYVFRGVDAVFPEGANIGIIGPNGGGKSTFLRILGGIDYPDSGTILSDRSFSWPLGLKGGFVNHLTGRENCRMICNLYGLAPRTIRKQLERIKELSGIGGYFEEPVKYYSSGMGGRLGFALSMAFDFDYFLIDEITAVGDAQFKELAKQALAEKAKRSRVIMVSHSMGDIKKFCDVGVVLKDGNLTVFEDLDEAIRAYLPQTEEGEKDFSELRREAKMSELDLQNIALPRTLRDAIPEITRLLQAIEEKLAHPRHTIRKGNEADFFARLAKVYQQLGNHGEAERWHRKAVAADPYRLDSHHQIAHLAARRNDRKAERDALRAAERVDPKNIRNAMIRADACFASGRCEEAQPILEEVLSRHPQNARAWSQRARAFQLAGEINKALDAQIKAVQHSPQNPNLYTQASQLLAATGALEESVLAAYKAHVLPRPSPEKHYLGVLKTLRVLDERITI